MSRRTYGQIRKELMQQVRRIEKAGFMVPERYHLPTASELKKMSKAEQGKVKARAASYTTKAIRERSYKIDTVTLPSGRIKASKVSYAKAKGQQIQHVKYKPKLSRSKPETKAKSPGSYTEVPGLYDIIKARIEALIKQYEADDRPYGQAIKDWLNQGAKDKNAVSTRMVELGIAELMPDIETDIRYIGAGLPPKTGALGVLKQALTGSALEDAEIDDLIAADTYIEGPDEDSEPVLISPDIIDSTPDSVIADMIYSKLNGFDRDVLATAKDINSVRGVEEMLRELDVPINRWGGIFKALQDKAKKIKAAAEKVESRKKGGRPKSK